MGNKANYTPATNIVQLFTLDEESETPEIKQNPDKWNRDYIRCILATEIILRWAKMRITL